MDALLRSDATAALRERLSATSHVGEHAELTGVARGAWTSLKGVVLVKSDDGRTVVGYDLFACADEEGDGEDSEGGV